MAPIVCLGAETESTVLAGSFDSAVSVDVPLQSIARLEIFAALLTHVTPDVGVNHPNVFLQSRIGEKCTAALIAMKIPRQSLDCVRFLDVLVEVSLHVETVSTGFADVRFFAGVGSHVILQLTLLAVLLVALVARVLQLVVELLVFVLQRVGAIHFPAIATREGLFIFGG
jgi:hypothetical protein